MSEGKHLPVAIIHTAQTCVQGTAVQVEGYAVQFRHPENITVGAPLAVALCSCCELIDDSEMHRVARVAVDAVTPAHVRRQMAVADGAEIVTEEDACAHFRIGHTKFWQLVGSSVFPQPMKRGRNNVWLMAELLRRYAAHELKEAEPAA